MLSLQSTSLNRKQPMYGSRRKWHWTVRLRKKTRGQNVSVSPPGEPGFLMLSRGKAEDNCAAQQTRTYHWSKITRLVYVEFRLGGRAFFCASQGLAEGFDMKLNCGGVEGCVLKPERWKHFCAGSGLHHSLSSQDLL